MQILLTYRNVTLKYLRLPYKVNQWHYDLQQLFSLSYPWLNGTSSVVHILSQLSKVIDKT